MENELNIAFGTEILLKLSSQLLEKEYTSIFTLVDTNTEKYCLPNFISQTGLDKIKIIVMRANEKHKNLKTCEKLWHQLSKLGGDRNSALINLGGGVVTDLGGFVASTFKRGIDFYNVPTTLLAMVDASIGGKTGIDLGSLKNQIGIIEEPKQVIIDTQWLNTLPQEEIRSGFAEMLKHGLIQDASYWEILKKINYLDPFLLSKYIKPSVAIKKKIVISDPKEKNLRKILNFGHTMGHAIESYFLTQPGKKRLLHGEAIAVGMVIEGYLGIHCCDFCSEAAKDIKNTFANHYPKILFNEKDRKGILKLLQHDKKNKAGTTNFVLLKAIGAPQIDVQVPNNLFDKAFDFYADP